MTTINGQLQLAAGYGLIIDPSSGAVLAVPGGAQTIGVQLLSSGAIQLTDGSGNYLAAAPEINASGVTAYPFVVSPTLYTWTITPVSTVNAAWWQIGFTISGGGWAVSIMPSTGQLGTVSPGSLPPAVFILGNGAPTSPSSLMWWYAIAGVAILAAVLLVIRASSSSKKE